MASALHISLLLLLSASAVHGGAQEPAPPLAPAQPPRHHHHHHHSHPPASPPSHPPSPPPAHPPAAPPVKPPPERKFVAVEGVVFCKSCKYRGVDTLMGASPLPGAAVKLQCNNTKAGLVVQGKTDKNGYFFFMPQKLTSAGSHKCKVYIVSSPLPACNVTTDLHSGVSGAILTPSKKPPAADAKKLPFVLFTVGPFAFEPHKKLLCH
ncbi:non-classical arabinogalactan protein 31-like [Andrographis paniculata]|uniref:non-classical arabinogalactan protein 31-like n=1 Tax=Andrographis paniculata TaxID=175694 RepID=UPI0021E78912|nr:non-classical arabinogalactan protein 31-like [Andrographis paniculata]